MKMKKNLFDWSFLLLAGLTLSACGGDDAIDTQTMPVQPTGKKTWTVTIDAGVTTRGLNDDLTPNWKTDDEVYVYYDGTKVGTLTPNSDSNSGDVTLSGELDDANYTAGGTLTLKYLYGSGSSDATPTYEGQNGTIADIAANYDYLDADVTINAVNSSAKSLSVGDASFKALQSVIRFRFTEPLLKDDVIYIFGSNPSTGPVSVTIESDIAENSDVYVAVPFRESPGHFTLSFQVTNSRINEEVYYIDGWGDKTVQNGKFYTYTVEVLGVRLCDGSPFWAVRNLGATSNLDLGDYYAWGETATKSNYSASTYSFATGGDMTQLTRYVTNASYGTIDNRQYLYDEDDVAKKNLSDWRLPTQAEVNQLFGTIEFTRISTPFSIYYRLEGYGDGYEGRKIYVPLGGYKDGTTVSNAEHGYYWTSYLNTTNNSCAKYLYLDRQQSEANCKDDKERFHGMLIRPVMDY